MTDLNTLGDAFDELERHGDAATAGMPAGLPDRRRPAVRRLVPVTVAAAVVAGMATSVALLAPGDGEPGVQAASPSPAPSTASTAPATAESSASRPTGETTPEEVAGKLRAALGAGATVTVTDTGSAMRVHVPNRPGSPIEAEPIGAGIVGTLTVSGVSGGFDLQTYPGEPGDTAQCNNADCTVLDLGGGTTLAVSTEGIRGPAGSVTHRVVLVRPNGTTTLMHVSNQQSPKGDSALLSQEPPLTTDEMITILTDQW